MTGMFNFHGKLGLSALIIALEIGCASKEPPPLYAPSTDQAGYATRYPQRLGEARGRVDQHESRSRRLMGGFESYPESLDKPDWGHVTRVVELADQAGRSEEYAQRYEDDAQVSAFFEENGDEIRNKVSGGVQWSAKNQGCREPGQLGAGAAHALNTAVEKQRQERLRERNEAHRYINLHREALGPKNVEALEKQADEISDVSYAVHVGMEQTRRQLEQRTGEAADVRSTLESSITELDAQAANAQAPQKDRDAAKKEADAARAALGQIQSEQQQAEYVLKELEQRITKLKDEYGQAMEKLRQKIQEKAQAAPATGTPAS